MILYPHNIFSEPLITGIILTYFIAELVYASFSLLNPFKVGQTAYFAHVGGFAVGVIIAGIFKGIKDTSYKKKLK